MTCSNVNNANVQQYATQMSAPAMFSKNSSLGNLKIDGRSFQVRELSGDAIDECLDWVVSIALSIGKFFARRAEDLGMFWSAFISMGNNANSNTIQIRIDALTGFRDWVDRPRSLTERTQPSEFSLSGIVGIVVRNLQRQPRWRVAREYTCTRAGPTGCQSLPPFVVLQTPTWLRSPDETEA